MGAIMMLFRQTIRTESSATLHPVRAQPAGRPCAVLGWGRRQRKQVVARWQSQKRVLDVSLWRIWSAR